MIDMVKKYENKRRIPLIIGFLLREFLHKELNPKK